MDELKECIFCKNKIKITATKCRFCQNWLNETQAIKNSTKKCPYCFEDIDFNATKCKFCKSIITSLSPTTSQEIRNKLKNYFKYKNSLCLECGYSGQMGVVQEIEGIELPWWLIVILILCGVGWLFLGILLIVKHFKKSYLCECPNCNNQQISINNN